MNLEDLRLWGTVDPDLVAAPGKSGCKFRYCTLIQGHDGPHLDAHPCSGRIFGIWFNDGEDLVTPEDVSGEAVKIVQKLNRARDEAVEAIEYVMDLKGELWSQHKFTDDPHVIALFDSGIWPRHENTIGYSGTEAERDADIRTELIDILGLNGDEEDW